MASQHFAELVDEIARAFGQGGRQLKETPDGLYLRTPDGIVYAFFEDPARLTAAVAGRLLKNQGEDLSRLVVLSLSPLSPSSIDALEEGGAAVVAGERFLRLLDGLELTRFVEGGSAAPSEPDAERRVLPTADRLDKTMERARLWMAWGVPAIALRFFDEAVRLKPEYVPGLLGRGMALLALGAIDPAEEAFEEALGHSPGDEEARIGLARITGARGDPEGEVEELGKLLKEDPRRLRTRAHLVAALAPQGRWKEVSAHVEEFLTLVPQDPYFHALASVCGERLGQKETAQRERRAADTLGMTPALWKSLREDLDRPVAKGRARGGTAPTGASRGR
jgi:tetratricopeptide (TPR) repeat protein